ncbi:MAG: CvpA family protein [Bacteroidota bacterium]|nr:CvpA family protein [Bacteroidota bacterium]
MNYLDIIILIPVLWMAFKGLKKGLIKEIASLAALILGIWVASSFSHFLVSILADNTKIDDNYIPLIAFGLIFILVVILIHLLSNGLDKLVNAIALKSLNKFGGAVFGAAKAVLIIAAILFLFNQFLVIKLELIPQEVMDDSFLYNPILDLIEFLYPKIENIKFEDFRLH